MSEAASAWHQALAVLFGLASAARHTPRPTRRSWDAALRARGIRPPVQKVFWLRLMAAAALLDALPGGGYRPTALLPGWFARPAHRQARDLVEAWVSLPQSMRARQDRRRIVRKLGHPLGQQPLTTSDRRRAAALRWMGIWNAQAGAVTALGRAALGANPHGPAAASSGASPAPAWAVTRYSVQVPANPPAGNLPLLWELEAFLQPYAPGRYLLTRPALRQAAQHGSPENLAAVLERGAGGPLPAEIRARILSLPQARLLAGAVLEFDSPAELAGLRQLPALRRQFEALLSPRHVYLPPYTQEAALAALARAGIPVCPPPAPPPEGTANPIPLTPGEIADLLTLALAAREADLGAGASGELIEKLSGMLPPALRRAARGRAAQAVQARQPQAPYAPPAEPGAVPPARVAVVQRAAEREEALTVWYSPAGAARPEQRRITPLAIEQRGPGLYLLAFCHRRRANRTFRLDRLLLEEEFANGHGPSP